MRLRAVLFLLTLASGALADEGQWMPGQLEKLDDGLLRSRGLEISVKELYSEKGGLLRAAVNLSGCSASFVSARGLIATNHHCAYRAIQAQASVEHDYLRHGFVAHDVKHELEAKGYTVLVLRSIRDVTREVRAAAQGASDDRARFEAVDGAQKKLVAECEKQPGIRCSVDGFYRGKLFQLFEALEIRDVRLVYAPPASIGDYGGEIDNWMWPRHTGDFALLRAYVSKKGEAADYAQENVPYQPQVHLRIGADGVRPGDFVAVLGYPRSTERYLSADEVARQVEQVFPALVDLYGEWIAILESEAARDAAVGIKVAALKKSLANRHKNALGMIAGIRRLDLVARRRAEETRLRQWAQGGARTEHAAALTELAGQSAALRVAFARELLLDSVSRGPSLLAVAVDLVRRAREQQKPDLERESSYMERNRHLLWKAQERRVRDFSPEVDARLMTSLATRAQTLPDNQRIQPLANLVGATLLPRLRRSQLANADHVRSLFDAADAGALQRDADPLMALARELVPLLEALDAERRTRAGRELRVGPRYFEMLEAVRGGPVYPDANGTLRVSFASVQGYEPQDGLSARPQTTLSGAIDKHTGKDPFALPKALLDQAAPAKTSYWADPSLGDVPLCFLSNADTTGGNSGSPVIDGRGRLVGLNFDRVWENIAGDFGYSPERSRNISVDVRFLLFLLDRVENASALLEELGVGEYRSAPARRSASAARPSADHQPDKPSVASCGCRAAGGSRSLGGYGLLFALAWARARRLRPRASSVASAMRSSQRPTRSGPTWPARRRRAATYAGK